MGFIRITCDIWLIIFAILLSILLRLCTTLHPYSGENQPPMYGDYEAQRHWMEITANLPINQWYKNTTDNNLQYWGLDYPPLTAYHMFLLGCIAKVINPRFVELHKSRGFESDSHRLFMRYTVIVSDILIYIPAIIVFYLYCKDCYYNGNEHGKIGKKMRFKIKQLPPALAIIVALLYPGIILIDHGHFQYNNVSLGLLIWSTLFLLKQHDILASICFCLAVNYKQMELYHSLPFFLYLLSSCVPKPGQTFVYSCWKLTKITLTVIGMFTLIWLPFLGNFDDFMAVLQRQFPVDRGLYEDKVANFWCTFNIFYKLKSNHTNQEMIRLCLFITLSMLFPSSIDLFLYPNRKKFVLSLINSSLTFFLFSYHVHEKSILLVAIPVLLYLPKDPFMCFWFLLISIFSMLPLFIKDHLLIATISLLLLFIVVYRCIIEYFYKNSLNLKVGNSVNNNNNNSNNSDNLIDYYQDLLNSILDIELNNSKHLDLIKLTYKQIIKNQFIIKKILLYLIIILSFFGCLILSLLLLLLKPPKRYPDLYQLLICTYCSIHFLGFFIYFNIKQIQIPQQFDDIKNVKLKDS